MTRLFKVALSRMNFLAHAYLSFGDEALTTGNLISDFIKGRAQYLYPQEIQKGIRLHRAIDTFTDAHEATKEAMQFFKTPYHLYSGPIMDVVYDYFLATDTSIFSSDTLRSFSQQVYQQLENQSAHLPPPFARMFYYMKTDDWLWNYRTQEGLQRSLRGLVRRATYLTESETAFRLFQMHYERLEGCYTAFIPDVKAFAKQQIAAPER